MKIGMNTEESTPPATSSYTMFGMLLATTYELEKMVTPRA
jgi:hypothetical protein